MESRICNFEFYFEFITAWKIMITWYIYTNKYSDMHKLWFADSVAHNIITMSNIKKILSKNKYPSE